MLLPAVDACRPREAVKAVRVMRPVRHKVEEAADTVCRNGLPKGSVSGAIPGGTIPPRPAGVNTCS